MKTRTVLGIGMAMCLAVVFGPPRTQLSAEDGKVKLVGEKPVVNNYIKADIAALKAALDKGELKDKKRARVLAVVIGLNAQAIGGDEGAAMYEQAYKVADALAQDDAAKAKGLAGDMGKSAKPSGDKMGDIVKFLFDDDPTVKDWDRDLTMQLFKTPRAGGFGYEQKIKDWAEAPPKAAKDFELAAGIAQRSAVIGMALEKMTAPKKAKPGTTWKKYAEDMQNASVDVMKAAEKKDGKALQAALNRVDAACTICHEKTK